VERFVLRTILSALSVLAAGTIFPNWIVVQSIESALVFALILGVLNAIVRPILLIFAIPFNLLTLGLFTVVVNAALFWLATQLPAGVQVTGFTGALIGSITVSIVSFVGSSLAR
jgi:putative membrane protein